MTRIPRRRMLAVSAVALPVLQRIVSFLVRATETMPSDDITSQMGTQLQNKIGRHAHSFFAATFLAEVIGEGWDTEPVRTALKRVIAAIVRSQTAQGHWGDQSWAPMLGTVMGWVSLRAGHYAGIRVGGSDRKSTRLNSSHRSISYAVFCLKKKSSVFPPRAEARGCDRWAAAPRPATCSRPGTGSFPSG